MRIRLNVQCQRKIIHQPLVAGGAGEGNRVAEDWRNFAKTRRAFQKVDALFWGAILVHAQERGDSRSTCLQKNIRASVSFRAIRDDGSVLSRRFYSTDMTKP